MLGTAQMYSERGLPKYLSFAGNRNLTIANNKPLTLPWIIIFAKVPFLDVATHNNNFSGLVEMHIHPLEYKNYALFKMFHP